MRRSYPRLEASARVTLRAGAVALEGWALNLSSGGVRAMIEGKAELGDVYSVQIGEAVAPQDCRVVWLQEEPDGMILGLAYEGSSNPPPPPPGHSQPPFRAAEPVALVEGPEIAVVSDSAPPSR
jgi:PilZ domain